MKYTIIGVRRGSSQAPAAEVAAGADSPQDLGTVLHQLRNQGGFLELLVKDEAGAYISNPDALVQGVSP